MSSSIRFPSLTMYLSRCVVTGASSISTTITPSCSNWAVARVNTRWSSPSSTPTSISSVSTSGATQALKEGLKNVAFLRTNIEIIERFFAEDEVQEIWLTFSDPQMKNPRKRLTSTYFMERYRKFLVDGGIIHLKTDSNFLFTYTTYMVEHNHLPVLLSTRDLYSEDSENSEYSEAASIQTYYESMWIARGLNIKYMKWRLPRTGTLSEPDVEIELDDYRSYHRTKRSSLDKAK